MPSHFLPLVGAPPPSLIPAGLCLGSAAGAPVISTLGLWHPSGCDNPFRRAAASMLAHGPADSQVTLAATEPILAKVHSTQSPRSTGNCRANEPLMMVSLARSVSLNSARFAASRVTAVYGRPS